MISDQKTGDTMRARVLCVIASLLILAVSSFGANDDCKLDRRSSALFAKMANPETASRQAWRASSKALNTLMTHCPAGPGEVESRRLFFEFVDEELSLDVLALEQVWKARGEPVSEGGMESVYYGRRDLRAYLDRIVDPSRDSEEASVILRHANGPAMARLGRLVRSDVIAMARTVPARKEDRDSQIEAVRALRLWIHPDNREFSAAEKTEMTAAILAALPPASDVPGGRLYLLARTCLDALANSNSAEAQQKVIAWANLYARTHGSKHELAQAAQKTVNTMEDLIHPMRHP